jgi:GcrA cell cycle regulator
MAEMSPQTAAVLRMVERAARAGEPCPMNATIVEAVGLGAPNSVTYHLGRLESLGLIVVERGHHSRVVAAADGGWRTADAGVGRGFWTPERDAELRRLWLQDHPRLSAVEIAARMGATKNMVVGRVGRFDPPLPRREAPLAASAPRTAPVRRAAGVIRPQGAAAVVVAQASAVRADAPRPAPAPRPALVARRPDVVRHKACQFPIGEVREPGFRFCEAATVAGSSYCAHHHAICWYQPQPKVAA